MQLHSEFDSGFSLQSHVQLFSLILLKVFSCFILFVSCFPRQQKETKYYCVVLCKHSGQLSVKMCLPSSEIAGKHHITHFSVGQLWRCTRACFGWQKGVVGASKYGITLRALEGDNAERHDRSLTSLVLSPAICPYVSCILTEASLFYLTCPIGN